MLGVTFFGLFLTPAFYVVLRRLSTLMWRGRQGEEKVIEPAMVHAVAGH